MSVYRRADLFGYAASLIAEKNYERTHINALFKGTGGSLPDGYRIVNDDGEDDRRAPTDAEYRNIESRAQEIRAADEAEIRSLGPPKLILERRIREARETTTA